MKNFTIWSIIFGIGCLIGSVVTTSIQNSISKTSSKSTVLQVVDKTDYKGLYNAYQQRITIKTDSRTITAEDGYKRTIVRLHPRVNTVTAGIGYVYSYNLRIVYSIGYQRQIEQIPLIIGGTVQFGSSMLGFNLFAGLTF